MEEENEDNFSRYTPQHPLPEEIKKLARDKTVCKYCGVSYLIHNEIKALEGKLKAAEGELSRLRGLEKREEVLKQETVLLKHQISDLKLMIETNGKLIESQGNEIINSKETQKVLEDTLKTYKEKYLRALKQCSNLNQTVKQWKENLGFLKDRVLTFQSEMSESMRPALENVGRISEQSTKELGTLQSQLECTEMEKLVLSQSNKTLSDNLKTKELEMKKLQDKLKSKSNVLKEKDVTISRLEHQIANLEGTAASLKSKEDSLNRINEEFKESQDQCKILMVELDQYKLNIKAKNSELTDALDKLKQLEHDHESSLQKLYLEIKGKENELTSHVKQIKTLENQCRELQKKEAESSQWSKVSTNEVQELKEALQRAKGDVAALKSERELMIEAHQNRIEDLRESFKNKMAEADDWPQKLQGALAAERSRHMMELKTFEENLKHQFVLELQIEKDKYNELLKKFQDQEKEKSYLRENQRALLEIQYKEQIDELVRQVTDGKKRGAEREEELTREITSLKKIIKDLQDRLARLDTSDSGKLAEYKNKLSQVQQDLLDARSNVTTLESQVKEAQEEAQFLQNVVRKECEERFELTEALSEARKELLQLKKPPGGYPSLQKRGSISSILSPSQPNSPAPLASGEDPGSKFKSQTAASSVSLSYSQESISARLNSSERNGDARLLESRKRIANVMGRR
ncbi:uncharacterized protein LOC131940234 [Physella acuta]|uniref:uncharacterized protein LOC131940234 n=1 Tax=Physella acuta TaxID=109671 RepID=UPI0027DE1E6C|nr:uncharacterized protein LOC131940234 [Physella acuta]